MLLDATVVICERRREFVCRLQCGRMRDASAVQSARLKSLSLIELHVSASEVSRCSGYVRLAM